MSVPEELAVVSALAPGADKHGAVVTWHYWLMLGPDDPPQPKPFRGSLWLQLLLIQGLKIILQTPSSLKEKVA